MFLSVVLFASLRSVSTDDLACEPGQWRCDDGQCAIAVVCDGELQCRDGSDESLARCMGTQRPFLELILHCSQPGSTSRQVCPEACQRWPEYCYYAVAAENGIPGTCKLPPFPRIGNYSIEAIERGTSTGLADFTLLYSCPPSFILHGYHPRCVSGSWTVDFPSCKQDRKCQLMKHPNVDYDCLDVLNHKCPEWVPSGQRVSAVCRPGYMREAQLKQAPMFCIDGTWNYVATCQKECGTVSPSDGTTRRGVMPWYTGIYSQLNSPYRQICGGSLVSTAVVISAARCFWTKGKGVALAKYFAVGVGKIYRPWSRSDDGQKSNVSDIKVPPRFTGRSTNYQDDIALVMLATRVMVTSSVRPVCLNFEVQTDELQLRPGNVGKIAVWNQMPMLKVVEMSYVNVAQCVKEIPADVSSYFTGDKICTRPMNGTMICRGDSGSGLTFPVRASGVERWYLRGIVSTVPRTHQDLDCGYNYIARTQIKKHNYIALTQIVKHNAFILSALTGYFESKGRVRYGDEDY